MRKPAICLCLFFFFSVPVCVKAQDGDLRWLHNWFDAWNIVHDELFRLSSTVPPEMIFYDDTFVYTTSTETAPTGTSIEGPSLYGRKLSWLKMPHKDTITLPGGRRVPVGLMSFAGPTGDGGSFFVMATPAFWKQAGVDSKELGLEKMLTGVFLHEFTHTRQYDGFGGMIDSIEKKNSFGEFYLSDDIVQDYFRKDSLYTDLFLRETALFYDAANSNDVKNLAAQGLMALKSRQAKFFTGDKKILRQLDDIFLSMEGLGQYAAVYWLMHPKGGKLSAEAAVNGFRRKRNQWSQEEGLALFLVLTKLTKPDWPREQFGSRPTSIIALLEKAVAE